MRDFGDGFVAALLPVYLTALKIAYDLLLLWAFRHVRPPEEQPGRQA